MTYIELPRALEEYFAFAETEPTRRGRRFSITLPYRNGERLERLQWWYHVSAAEELMYEGTGLATFRARAIVRFCAHIERWLDITRQRLHGEDAIPRIGPRIGSNEPAAPIAVASAEPTQEAIWPVQQIAS